MPSESLSIVRVLTASRPRVFEAWTRPELLARWFFPGSNWSASIDHDFRIGGRWEVRMQDGAGVEHRQFGEYREIVPDTRLVFSWSCPDLAVVDSVVTVELRDHPRGTELHLKHQLPPDPAVRRGHEEGWQGCLESLAKFLENHGEN